jgi:hypothetical protein
VAAAATRGTGRPLGRSLLGFAASFLAVVAAGYAWCFRGLPFLELARANHLWPFGAAAPEWIRIYTVMGGYDRPVEALLAMSRAAAFLVALASAVAAAWAIARGRDALLRRALVVAGGSLLLLLLVTLGSRSRDAAVPFLSLAPAAVGASFVSGLLGPRGTRKTRRAALLALSVAGGLLLARVGLRGWAKGPFAGLGYTLSVPLLVYGTGRGLVWPFRRSPAEARAVLRSLAALAIPILMAACVFRARELRQSLESFSSIAAPGGTVWMPRPWTTAFGRIGGVIGRPGSEEVAILPETHGLDFLYGRVNASPAPNLVPGILDEPMESRILEEWTRRPPATVVIFTYPYWVYGSAGFGVDYGIRLRGWISSRYSLLGRAGPDETPYVVLALRGGVR